MTKPNDIEEAASRARDIKRPEEQEGNYGGKVSDGKNEDTPQGGKRGGPGRWIDPETSRRD